MRQRTTEVILIDGSHIPVVQKADYISSPTICTDQVSGISYWQLGDRAIFPTAQVRGLLVTSEVEVAS